MKSAVFTLDTCHIHIQASTPADHRSMLWCPSLCIMSSLETDYRVMQQSQAIYPNREAECFPCILIEGNLKATFTLWESTAINQREHSEKNAVCGFVASVMEQTLWKLFHCVKLPTFKMRRFKTLASQAYTLIHIASQPQLTT